MIPNKRIPYICTIILSYSKMQRKDIYYREIISFNQPRPHRPDSSTVLFFLAVSCALHRVLTAGPPGKSPYWFFIFIIFIAHISLHLNYLFTHPPLPFDGGFIDGRNYRLFVSSPQLRTWHTVGHITWS